jgi:hypothetical protein
MPPENPRTIWSARSVSLNCSSSSERARSRFARALAEIGAVEQQDFARRQSEIQIRTLRHHADQALDLHLLLPHVESPIQAWPPVGRTRVVSTPMVVDLPAPFGPSRPKISPGAHFERDAVERNDLRLSGCFSFAARRATGQAVAATKPPNTGSEISVPNWRRVIDLAQIYSSNAWLASRCLVAVSITLRIARRGPVMRIPRSASCICKRPGISVCGSGIRILLVRVATPSQIICDEKSSCPLTAPGSALYAHIVIVMRLSRNKNDSESTNRNQ